MPETGPRKMIRHTEGVAGRSPEGASGALEAEATVREALPNALFRVQLATGTRGSLVAHVAGDSSLLRLRPGDAVVVELVPYDAGRGRIVRRR